MAEDQSLGAAVDAVSQSASSSTTKDAAVWLANKAAAWGVFYETNHLARPLVAGLEPAAKSPEP